jgi:uncharacterized membrane protein (UPF0127 family)
MKTVKTVVLALLAVAVVLALLAAILFVEGSGAGAAGPAYLFSANGREFNISLIAANQLELETGLMNTTITNSTMMLFVFPSPGIYPFWMENTYSNLDIMWLNVSGDSGNVVYLARNTTSCVGKNETWCMDNAYTPNAYANYVIEAKAGFAKTNNIGVGTRVGLSEES